MKAVECMQRAVSSMFTRRRSRQQSVARVAAGSPAPALDGPSHSKYRWQRRRQQLRNQHAAQCMRRIEASPSESTNTQRSGSTRCVSFGSASAISPAFSLDEGLTAALWWSKADFVSFREAYFEHLEEQHQESAGPDILHSKPDSQQLQSCDLAVEGVVLTGTSSSSSSSCCYSQASPWPMHFAAAGAYDSDYSDSSSDTASEFDSDFDLGDEACSTGFQSLQDLSGYECPLSGLTRLGAESKGSNVASPAPTADLSDYSSACGSFSSNASLCSLADAAPSPLALSH